MLRFKLIVAMCPNGGIGYKGGLPWPHNKTDMAHFAKRTTGGGNNAVIMGAKTWDSIPVRPLRRRANLILSSQTHEPHESHQDQGQDQGQDHSAHWFRTVPDLFAHLDAAKYDEVWIIGGASIYEQFLAMHATGEIRIDEMCVTTIDGVVHGCDTFFPLSIKK